MTTRFLIFAVALLALSGGVARAQEPRNLDLLKDELRTYVSSGRYAAEIAAVAAQARAALTARANAKVAGERLAVVIDLDETLLSNLTFMSTEDFGGSDSAWDAWLLTGQAAVSEPVRAFYEQARQLGVDVYFLTSRKEHLRAATVKNLRAVGCDTCAGLLLEPEGWKGTARAFKTGERQRLTQAGHVIIVNLGDQRSDLDGGYAERAFKLPDPFYLVE
ncbi:MAG: HAD family acid phosphatase [Opitutales bacterium]